MTSELKKINHREGEQAAQIEQAKMQELYPSISKIEEGFSKVDNNLTDAQKGAHILTKAMGDDGSGKKLGLVDSEIKRLSREIIEERNKEKPDWTKIDSLLRQQAAYLYAKVTGEDKELTQDEIDRMREDIEKVKSTYNTTWSLICAVGSGALSIIGGLIGIGGNAAGLHQLANGAAKVSKTTQSWISMSSTFGNIGHGIDTAAGRPLQSYYQGKQQGYNFELQLATHRKDTASQSANHNRQMQQAANQNYERSIESAHSAGTRIFSAPAA